MDLSTFKASLKNNTPPKSCGVPLQAMWFAAKGDWDQAHKLAQSDNSGPGAWAHAYLHRVEGDDKNAGYWYLRAGKDHSSARLETEWTEIVETLLAE